MRVKKLLGLGLVICTMLSYGYDLKTLDKIDVEYQELLQKEVEKIQELKAEKIKLQEELNTLKEKLVGKEEIFSKLKVDSQIRWHRDEYKKLLSRYESFFKKLEKAIMDKEQKIIELERLINILEQ